MLDVYFPKESGIEVIAEPGCYYVSSAFTLAVNIIAKKAVDCDKLLPSGGKQCVSFTPCELVQITALSSKKKLVCLGVYLMYALYFYAM